MGDPATHEPSRHRSGPGRPVAPASTSRRPGLRRHRGRAGGGARRPGWCAEPGRVHLRHRPDGADDARPDRRCAAGRRSDLDLLPLRRLDPAYRACFADGGADGVRSGHEAMRDEIERTSGSVDAAAFDGFVEWLRRLYVVSRCHSSTPTTTRRSGCSARRGRSPSWSGWAPSGGSGAGVRRRFRDPRLHRLFSFQRPCTPGSPRTPPWPCTLGDRLHGQHQQRTTCPRAGCVPCRRRSRRRPRRPARRCATATRCPNPPVSSTGRVAGVRTAAGERMPAERGGSTVDLPVAYRTFLGPTSSRGQPGRAPTPPSAVVWHISVRGVPEPPISPQRPLGAGLRPSSSDDLLQARPADQVTRPGWSRCPRLDEPSAAPDGSCARSMCWSPCPTWTDGSTGARRPGRCGTGCTLVLAAHGYPDDVVVEELVTPLEWEAQGMAAVARCSRWPTRSPDRSVRAGQHGGSAGRDWFFAGSGTVQGHRRTHGSGLRQAGCGPGGKLPAVNAQLVEGLGSCAS